MTKTNPHLIIEQIFFKILGRAPFESEISVAMSGIGPDPEPDIIVEQALHALCVSEDFLLLESPNKNFSQVENQDIFYAYKFILGRLPESFQTYETQKNIGTVTALVEAFFDSPEFKKNPILKNVISLKRKPAGFEQYEMHLHSASPLKIAVISGCQGKMLADLFQAKTGAIYVPNIFFKADADFAQQLSDGSYDHSELFESADLIYTQKMEIFNALISHPTYGHRVRLLPLIEYSGFQPDQCYLTDITTGRLVLGPLGEYQSAIVSSAYYSGLSVEHTMQLFNNCTYELLGFSENVLASEDSFKSQAYLNHYPLEDLLTKWNLSGPWMRTINHPKKQVLNDIVDIALAREGISPIVGAEEYVIDDLADNVDWPVYPSLLENFPSASLSFKLPKAFSPRANSATFLKLADFVELTFQSLTGIAYDQVYCHQLGRPVKLFDSLVIQPGLPSD